MPTPADHPSLLPRPLPLWAVQVPRYPVAAVEQVRRNAIADAVEIVRAGLAGLAPPDPAAEAEADERRPEPWPLRDPDCPGMMTPDEALAGCEVYPAGIRVADVGEDGDLLIEGWWPADVLLAVVLAHSKRLGLGYTVEDVARWPEDAQRITCLFARHSLSNCPLIGWEPDDWDVRSAHDGEAALEPPRDDCPCEEYGWWTDYGPADRPNAHRMTLLRS